MAKVQIVGFLSSGNRFGEGTFQDGTPSPGKDRLTIMLDSLTDESGKTVYFNAA